MVEALEPFALYEAGPAEARVGRNGHGLRAALRDPAGEGPGPGGQRHHRARPPPRSAMPAITAESGECGLVQEEAVARHVRGLDGVLALLGMADRPDGAEPPAAPTSAGSCGCAASRGAGGRRRSRPGESVAEGQTIGTISTLDGSRGAGDDHRARGRGPDLHHQLARGRRRRPPARPGRRLTSLDSPAVPYRGDFPAYLAVKSPGSWAAPAPEPRAGVRWPPGSRWLLAPAGSWLPLAPGSRWLLAPAGSWLPRAPANLSLPASLLTNWNESFCSVILEQIASFYGCLGGRDGLEARAGGGAGHGR